MKTIERKVYYCEFCNRHHSLSASVTTRHEKYCTCNPNNWHACFHYCRHLVRTEIKAVIKMFDEDEVEIITPAKIEFTCSKLKKKLYSFKAEKKGLLKKGYIIDAERMPLKCDSYKMEEGYNQDQYNS